MSTTTIALEAQNIAASAQSLRTEFFKAKLAGVKTTTAKGTVQVQMAVAGLADYQFACADQYCSWTATKRKIVLDLKGFSVEQRARKGFFVVVFRHSSLGQQPLLSRKMTPVREIFYRRSLRAIEELRSMDEKKLAEAVQAPTDYSVLVAALTTEEALASVRSHDPLAGPRLRGIEAKQRLIDGDGGALSAVKVAELLHISRQAIDKRRREGKLLAVELGKKGYYYPSWQFGLKGLEEVLVALKGRDAWEQLNFFLNPNAGLDDRTPLNVLQEGKDDVAGVVNAALGYGDQGG